MDGPRLHLWNISTRWTDYDETANNIYIVVSYGITACACPDCHRQLAAVSRARRVSDLIDTGKGVWYVTGGCLYYYDKKDDETRFYEGGKELSDFTIRFVRYNSERDMLAVAYSNGNIDMILPDGSRVNLPEIKDATANVEKSLNDIVFDGKRHVCCHSFRPRYL